MAHFCQPLACIALGHVMPHPVLCHATPYRTMLWYLFLTIKVIYRGTVIDLNNFPHHQRYQGPPHACLVTLQMYLVFNNSLAVLVESPIRYIIRAARGSAIMISTKTASSISSKATCCSKSFRKTSSSVSSDGVLLCFELGTLSQISLQMLWYFAAGSRFEACFMPVEFLIAWCRH